MRISSVKIRSFGNLRDIDLYTESPMTVIYGGNEAGKTSLMEFIRSTLFPDSQRKHYPEHTSSDVGEMKLLTDTGQELILLREGKKVSSEGTFPDMSRVDPSTYRAVFAMSSDDLRNSKVISSGDIKNRFLTVPGGESLPEIIGAIDSEMRMIMSPDRRSSSTKMESIRNEIDVVKSKMDPLVRRDGEYSDLCDERRHLEVRLKELDSEMDGLNVALEAYGIRKSQSVNLSKLKELEGRRDSMSASASLTRDDIDRYGVLKGKCNSAFDSTRDATAALSEVESSISGLDPEALIRYRNEILELKQREQGYNRLSNELNRLQISMPTESDRCVYARDESREHSRRGRNMMLLIGAVLMASSFVAGLLTDLSIAAVGAAISLVVIFAAFLTGRRKLLPDRNDQTDNNSHVLDVRSQALSAELAGMDRELDLIASRCGMSRTSFGADVGLLFDAAMNAPTVHRAKKILDQSKVTEKCAKDELHSFLSKFGSEERFLILSRMLLDYENVCREIDTLKESIISSGSPDTGTESEPPDTAGVREDMASVQRRMGEIDAQLKAIHDDEGMERLMDLDSSLRTELFNAVKRWAVLSLASSMVEDACNTMYSDVQPKVIGTADGLIRRMTGGRYGLDMDVRKNEVTLVSDAGRKRDSEWSTGLGDQVYLSIKLAIAKEISSVERLPILLDDVLLTFDSDRKRNAFNALVDISDEMQIILFTCDADVLSMASSDARCGVVELS